MKIIMQKLELQFKKSRRVNHKRKNYVDVFLGQASAYFSFPISSLCRISPKSNIFPYIDQLQEYVGSEDSFSSEDG
jgi:hypothetical protein